MIINALSDLPCVVLQALPDRAVIKIDLSGHPEITEPVIRECLAEFHIKYYRCTRIDYAIQGSDLVITAWGEVTMRYSY